MGECSTSACFLLTYIYEQKLFIAKIKWTWGFKFLSCLDVCIKNKYIKFIAGNRYTYNECVNLWAITSVVWIIREVVQIDMTESMMKFKFIWKFYLNLKIFPEGRYRFWRNVQKKKKKKKLIFSRCPYKYTFIRINGTLIALGGEKKTSSDRRIYVRKKGFYFLWFSRESVRLHGRAPLGKLPNWSNFLGTRKTQRKVKC